MSNNLEKKESLSKIKVLYFIFNLLPLIVLGFGITFTIVNGIVYNWHKTILIICIIISILVLAASIGIVGAVRMIVFRKEYGMTKDVMKQQEKNQKKYEKIFAEQEKKKADAKAKEEVLEKEKADYDDVIVENKKITSAEELAVIVVHSEIPSLRKVIFFKDKAKFDSLKIGDKIRIPAFEKDSEKDPELERIISNEDDTQNKTELENKTTKTTEEVTVENENENDNNNEDNEDDEIEKEAIAKINGEEKPSEKENVSPAPSPIEFKSVDIKNKDN